MRQYRNDGLIRRNATLAKVVVYSGLGLLVVAFILSIIRRENIVQPIFLSLVGVLFSWFGMPMFNQWGRHPRMDEILDAAFKGLDDRYALFHYLLGSRHVLITPAGVFALIPRLEAGKITYSKKTWWKTEEKSGFLRRSGSKAIRDIEKQAEREIRHLEKALTKLSPEHTDVVTSAIFIFLNAGADVKADSAPWLTVHMKKAKSEIRKLQKQRSLDANEINRIVGALNV